MDQEQDTSSAGTGDAPKSRMDRARDYVGSKYSRVKEKAQDIDVPEFVDQVRAYVRSNPGKALLMSVAAGFLIGLLLRRRDDDD